MIPLTRHLLIRHRLLATRAELRFIGHRPPLSLKVTSWPKMYRSDSLEPDQIDDLYSELVCVPFLRRLAAGRPCTKNVTETGVGRHADHA